MEAREFNRLLKRIKYDKSALVKIYDDYYDKITLYISQNYRDVNSEDVAQHFFTDLLKYEVTYTIEYPTTWVLTCCSNIAKKILIEEPLTISSDEVQISDNTNYYEQINNSIVVNAIMSKLNELDRKIIFLCYWQGFSLREIAERLDMKYGTVKQRHTRGIKKLKKFLNGVADLSEIELYIRKESSK